jgi:uncharacterized protein
MSLIDRLTSSTSRAGAPAGRTDTPATPVAPVQPGVLAFGGLAAVAVGAAVVAVGGVSMLWLYLIGIALGLVLFHSRFGFTSAWRQLVAVRQGRALRAHMLMLATACVLFAPILSGGVTLAGPAEPFVYPVGTSVVVGAFLFGIGMQLGGSCASGTLFSVGSGQTSIMITLAGFIAGSVIGAYHFVFWTEQTPTGPAVSLAETGLGYPGALAVSLLVMGAIVAVTLLLARRNQPPQIERPPAAQGIARAVRGSWPLWVGAVLLAGLNALTLWVSGSGWGVTSAFALWGSKLLGALGVDVASWPYWANPENAAMLASPVLADKTSVMDFGVIVGALIASAAAGSFVMHRKIPGRIALGAVIGGLLMGYGARIAYGCNIGAYFGGIASFSLHGWLWGVVAIAGTAAGLWLRPAFGLTNPKPEDSSC